MWRVLPDKATGLVLEAAAAEASRYLSKQCRDGQHRAAIDDAGLLYCQVPVNAPCRFRSCHIPVIYCYVNAHTFPYFSHEELGLLTA